MHIVFGKDNAIMKNSAEITLANNGIKGNDSNESTGNEEKEYDLEAKERT